MIDIRKLKELVRLMVENDLSELDLRDQEETVSLKRPVAGAMPPPQMGAPVIHHQSSGQTSGPPSGAGDSAPEVRDADVHAITSPMVGTFYATPNPESPTFVNVGASVGPDTVVCLVEAMKVFSEIKAECSGTIEKILVKNGEAVEFGQELFLVRTS